MGRMGVQGGNTERREAGGYGAGRQEEGGRRIRDRGQEDGRRG
jgi:hypothetical protein